LSTALTKAGLIHFHAFFAATENVLSSPNSTWLVTSRLDTTRHVRRVARIVTSVSRLSHSSWRACRAVLSD